MSSILEIGTHIEDTMIYQKVNSHTSWDLQNPYNLRLNQKHALLAGSKKKKNNNFQHYNILSAYEVKSEASTSSSNLSLVFYHMGRFRKTLVKK
jgi:hypothetical protein